MDTKFPDVFKEVKARCKAESIRIYSYSPKETAKRREKFSYSFIDEYGVSQVNAFGNVQELSRKNNRFIFIMRRY